MQLILDKLATLSRRAWWLALGHALGIAALRVLATLLVLAGIDFLFKFHDYGVRFIFSAAFWGVVIWAAYRYLWPALSRRWGEVALAQRVERKWPQLADRLSSAVAFLRQEESDHLAGSAALRRAVVTAATIDIERLDFADVLNSRPTRRALGVALGMLLVLAMLGFIYPALINVGLTRLLFPWANTTWPQWHNLQIVGTPPARLAVGQTFELNVTDRDGRLPDDAELQLRFDSVDDQTPAENRTLTMQRLNDVFIARYENVARSFDYRVVGGDDRSMPWHRLEVVEPPQIESLSVTLQPPAYTGWPAVASERHIQALRGTQVAMRARVSKKLASARIVCESGQTVEARIGEDGHSVVIPGDVAQPFVVDQSTAYWLEMTDEEGLTGGQQDRWELRAVTDNAPTLGIEQPSSNLFVTAAAEIPLRLLVKDDIAVARVDLQVTRSIDAETTDFTESLFVGPETAPPQPQHGSAIPRDGDTRAIDYTWQLAPQSLKPGTQLTLVAVAADYLPQSATSPERRVTIITGEELEERLAGRQGLILAELARALKMQQDTRALVQDVAVQHQRVGKLQKPDIDHTQAAQLNQRSVAEVVTGSDRGLPSQIDALLAELSANRVDSPDMRRRLSQLREQLGQLDRQHLTPIERQLTDVVKRATTELNQSEADSSAKVESSLGKPIAGVIEHQDRAIESLERMLADLSQWDNYRRFGRELSQLKAEQSELESQTAALAKSTVGKSASSLTPQERADLAKMAARQQDLARQFEKTRQQMADMARDLADTDPLAAGTLADAADEAIQRGTGGRMRTTAGQIEENRINQAQRLQAQSNHDLDELLNILANRREQELARLVAGLRHAESRLAELRRQQASVADQLRRQAKEPDSAERRRQLERLTRQQRELERETARLARKLQRLHADRASRSSNRAAGNMGSAGEAGQQQDAGGAADGAEQAEKDLEEAQAQLAQRRKQAEADLAMEQVGKLQDALANLQGRQQTLQQETSRLEKLRTQQGQWTRAQLLTLRDTARNQLSLTEETGTLAENLAQAEVFRLALKLIEADMRRAAAQLDARQTDRTTQTAQQEAIRRLAQLTEAFRSAQKAGGQQEGGQAGGEGGGQSGENPSAIRALAEVQLLKLMQQQLNQQFVELTRDREQLPPDELNQKLSALSGEQEELAKLLQNFSVDVEDESASDDPSRLPELDLEERPLP